jgi:hypothetical protein
MSNNNQNKPQQGSSESAESQSARNDAFLRHLEKASSVVQKWPAWKQQVLGGLPAPAPPRGERR